MKRHLYQILFMMVFLLVNPLWIHGDEEVFTEFATVQPEAEISFANDYPDVSMESYYEPEPADDYFIPKAEVKKQEAADLYQLKIGDKMVMAVYGEEHTSREVAVDPTGSISYLFVNSLFVLGKTIHQVRQEIEEKLKGYYRYPLLMISPINFLGATYTIIGEVVAPGNKIIRGDTTLLSAICDAKGFTNRLFREQTVDMEDLGRSFISRHDKYLPVDFTSLVIKGDLSQDVPLESGDYIYIATSQSKQVYVLGEVNAPTTIDYVDLISLTEAIAETGGLSLHASSRVAVIRGALSAPTYYYIDFNRIVKGYASDFELQPGDIVYVPPFKFTNLKELIQNGVSSFVSFVASQAGTKAYIAINPAAQGSVESPVPVINGTGSAAISTGVVVPGL